MKTAIAFSGFYARHLIASIVSVAVPTVLVAVGYMLLLATAVVTRSGMGGPLALPFWIAFTLVVSTVYTALFLFPCVVIAEITSRRFGKWQHLAQIPISTLALAGVIVILSRLAHALPDYSKNVALFWADYPVHVFVLLAIPLGLYWWTMKLVQAGIAVPTAVTKVLRVGNSSE